MRDDRGLKLSGELQDVREEICLVDLQQDIIIDGEPANIRMNDCLSFNLKAS